MAAVGKTEPERDIGDRVTGSFCAKGDFAIGRVKSLVTNDLGNAAIGGEYPVQTCSRDLTALHQQGWAELALIEIGFDELEKPLPQKRRRGRKKLREGIA